MINMNNDMLSQEEIDLLLKGTENTDNEGISDEKITDIEKDTLGEIGNISMGTAATTLSTLLNREIPLLHLAELTTRPLSHLYPIPY